MALALLAMVQWVVAVVGSPVFMLLRYRFASREPAAPIKFGLGQYATIFARWDPSLLPRELLSLLEPGLPAIPDYVPPALTSTHRVRSYSIEGMRVDVGGLRIPFRARGGIVYGLVHTFNPMHGMRIGEASNP